MPPPGDRRERGSGRGRPVRGTGREQRGVGSPSGAAREGQGRAVRWDRGCGGCRGLARGRPSAPRPGAAEHRPCGSGGAGAASEPGSRWNGRLGERREVRPLCRRRGASLTLGAAALPEHRVGWVGSALVLGPFVHVPCSASFVSGSVFSGSWVRTVSLCEELGWSLDKSCRNASREILSLSK